MTDLADLLDRAAGPAAPTLDVRADLTRGRRALARSRRRRGALGLAGVAAAGVVGVASVRYVAVPDDPAPTVVTDPDRTDSSGVQLLAEPADAGPYTFDNPPEGWYVQGTFPSAVVIAPSSGDVDPDPTVFAGKVVIMFDGNGTYGEELVVDGRSFWRSGDSGYTTLSTRTLPGEPAGMIRVQFPDGAGWGQQTMLRFLAGVHVHESAQQGVG